MNIKELRIGNYVHYGYDVKVTELDVYGAGIMDLNDDEASHFYSNKELLKPILLTEEWLLKFGFENVDYGFTKKILTVSTLQLIWGDGWIYPQIIEEAEMNSETIDVVSLNRIEFVHQLQNLYFTITGEELKLNKVTNE